MDDADENADDPTLTTPPGDGGTDVVDTADRLAVRRGRRSARVDTPDGAEARRTPSPEGADVVDTADRLAVRRGRRSARVDTPDGPEARRTPPDGADDVEAAAGVEGAEGADDPVRPRSRVVQLERPRSRRRRGSGSGVDGTRPAGRWPGGAAAGEHESGGPDGEPGATRAGRGPQRGPGRRTGDVRHAGDDHHDAASPEGGEPDGATEDTAAAGLAGVTALTTLRGRRGRGDDLGDGPDRSDPGEPADPGSDPDAVPATAAAPASLHPRMRSRRIAVRRSEGLRRLRRLTWGLAGLALLVDGSALAHTGFVDVDRFAIAGTTHTPPAAVQHASGIHPGDALLTLDESGAEKAIETLPWVAEADVVRQWPSTVRITVTERQPVAVLQVSEDPAAPLALVDATGRVLEIGAHPEGLIAVTQAPPELEEGGRVPPEARDALQVVVAAAQRMPGTIVSLTVGLEATLGSGGVVLFGSADDLDEKLLALSTVLARVDLDCLESLNLAVPDHPALRRSC